MSAGPTKSVTVMNDPFLWKKVPQTCHPIWNRENLDKRWVRIAFGVAVVLLVFASGFFSPIIYFIGIAIDVTSWQQQSNIKPLFAFIGGCIYFSIGFISLIVFIIDINRMCRKYKQALKMKILFKVLPQYTFHLFLYCFHPTTIVCTPYIMHKIINKQFKQHIKTKHILKIFGYYEKFAFYTNFISDIKNCNDNVINDIFHYHITNKIEKCKFSNFYQSLIKYIINLVLIEYRFPNDCDKLPDFCSIEKYYLHHKFITKTQVTSTQDVLTRNNSRQGDAKSNSTNVNNTSGNQHDIDAVGNLESIPNNDRKGNGSKDKFVMRYDVDKKKNWQQQANEINVAMMYDVWCCLEDCRLNHFILAIIGCIAHLFLMINNWNFIVGITSWFIIYVCATLVVNSYCKFVLSKFGNIITCIDIARVCNKTGDDEDSAIVSGYSFVDASDMFLIETLYLNKELHQWIRFIMFGVFINAKRLRDILIKCNIHGIDNVGVDICTVIVQYLEHKNITKQNVLELNVVPEHSIGTSRKFV